MPSVQIVYASRHGGTAGIADRIAEVLRTEGADVAVADAADRPDAGDFDAYVIGSGVYIGSWLKEGTEFLERNQATLATRPVWLFSSGPLPGSSKAADAKATEAKDPLALALVPRRVRGAAVTARSPSSARRSTRVTTTSSWAPSTRPTRRSRSRSGSSA
jgi:menaquinone-dependent protoporphyrinogen IX oxidase